MVPAAATEVNDFPSYVSWDVNTRTQAPISAQCLDHELCSDAQDPYLWEKKALPLSSPLYTSPHHPVLCPLTFITHFLFMLGRNCGCSWWFEVRRDWPWVTLNKYTRTSQEGAGRLRLPPNHPWLISWPIQGDFLCTLPTTTVPSPTTSQTHRKWWNRGGADGATQAANQMELCCTVLPLQHAWTHMKNCTYCSSSDQLLLRNMAESHSFTAVGTEHMDCNHTLKLKPTEDEK